MSPAKDHLLKKLLLFYEEKGMYDSLSQFLEWDLETYMPSSGIEFRSRNLRYLQGESHKRATSRKIPSLLSALKKENLTLREKALVREMEHDYKRETKLPRSFVRTFSSTVSKAMHTWREAKEKNDFALFAPHLKKLVTLCRKKADFFGFSAHPYDALLDLFEPGMTVATVEPLFAALKTRLTHLSPSPSFRIQNISKKNSALKSSPKWAFTRRTPIFPNRRTPFVLAFTPLISV